MTGGRIKRVEDIINNEKFFLTYGDGLSDINFNDLLNFHNQNKKSLTISAIQPEGKFGALNIVELNNVLSFEKSIEYNFIFCIFILKNPQKYIFVQNLTIMSKYLLRPITLCG
jgi:NDP-sugar pyrophosphorylase family protein